MHLRDCNHIYLRKHLCLLPLWQKAILLLLLAGNLVYYCLVFALFRGDCIIPPHDALDCVVPWLEMFRQNHLFLAVDSETPCFLGLSTANYALINFSFQSFLFAFFESFTAFALNYVFAFFLSFVGMALLLKAILHNNTFLNLIVALVYSSRSRQFCC